MAVVTELLKDQTFFRPDLSSIWSERLKGGVEVLFSFVLLIVLFPVLAILALAIKLTSSGPVFYSQVRLGRFGRPYRIYKLRSMRHNCERDSGVRWSLPGDSRITPLGRFLRASHLDELPQLWNVICRDMSLVGPRPERPEIIPSLEKEIADYRERLSVLPGVTGLAQVHLPPDTDLDSVRRKVAYDLYYIHQRSLWMDLRIIACTALKVAVVPFQLVNKLLLPAVKLQDDELASLTPPSVARGAVFPRDFSFPPILTAATSAKQTKDLLPTELVYSGS